jgi:hypothetical protein
MLLPLEVGCYGITTASSAGERGYIRVGKEYDQECLADTFAIHFTLLRDDDADDRR